MPIPLALAIAGLAAGAGLGGDLLNRRATKKQNKASQDYADKAYARQRADNLADYESANQYNSPEQQMIRLQQAGLNPNLVYGKGADTVAAQIKGADTKNAQFDVPTTNAGEVVQNSLSMYQDSQIKQAQTDNLYKQNEVLQQDAALKTAQTSKAIADTATTQFQLGQSDRLKDIAYEQASLNTQETKQKIDASKQSMAVELSRLEEYKLSNSANIKKTYQDILTSKIQNSKTQQETKNLRVMEENLRKEGFIKGFEIEMNKAGITKSDPAFYRLLTLSLQKGVYVKPRSYEEQKKTEKTERRSVSDPKF